LHISNQIPLGSTGIKPEILAEGFQWVDFQCGQQVFEGDGTIAGETFDDLALVQNDPSFISIGLGKLQKGLLGQAIKNTLGIQHRAHLVSRRLRVCNIPACARKVKESQWGSPNLSLVGVPVGDDCLRLGLESVNHNLTETSSDHHNPQAGCTPEKEVDHDFIAVY
jgi:hypothetical protein